MALTYRTTDTLKWGTGKTAGLTNIEIDNNFYELASAALGATSANTASKIVARDASGNFQAGIITTAGRQENYGITTNAGTVAGLMGGTSGGTLDAPTQTLNGVDLYKISGLGYTGSAWTGGASIAFVSTENITSINRGTNVVLTAIVAGQAGGTSLVWNGATVVANGTTLTGNTGTVTSVSGTGTVSGLSLSGTVTSTGSITLSGTLSTPVSTINDSTTLGQNLVKLTNPSAIRFLRVNANNTVSTLSDVDFRTAIGASEVMPAYTPANTVQTLVSRDANGNFTAGGITLQNITESTSTTTGALIVTGGVGVGGTINATDFNSVSDIRFKKDLEKITDALSKVKQLTGYTYTLIDSDTRSTGLIAQEVELVQPESVGGNEDKKTVSYGSMMGLIVEAIKELDMRLSEIQNQISNK